MCLLLMCYVPCFYLYRTKWHMMCLLRIQISFKYTRILFIKQENFINFIYFYFLTSISCHIFNMRAFEMLCVCCLIGRIV